MRIRTTQIFRPNNAALCGKQALQRLQTLPGVISASESIITPISGTTWNNEFFLLKGGGPTGDDATADINYVSPEYFATLRIAASCADGISMRAIRPALPSSAIINETMARRFLRQQQIPSGEYLRIDDLPGMTTPPMQIVGVVKDAKYEHDEKSGTTNNLLSNCTDDCFRNSALQEPRVRNPHSFATNRDCSIRRSSASPA